MKTGNADDAKHGRPYWKIPRRFVIETPWAAGEWSRLESAAQTVLPALEIFGDGTQTDIGFDKLSRCCGSTATVSEGLRQMANAELITREKRQSIHGGWIRCKTRFHPILISKAERFARFDGNVVSGAAWREMTPAARAVYVCLLCGVQHERLAEWIRSAPTCAGKDLSGASIPAPRSWLDPGGKFAWRAFVRAMKADNEMCRRWGGALPVISFRKHDAGAIGIGTLSMLSGFSEPAVKSAIPQIEELNLALCIHHGNAARRFMLPPAVDWQHQPDFLPPKQTWNPSAPPRFFTEIEPPF